MAGPTSSTLPTSIRELTATYSRGRSRRRPDGRRQSVKGSSAEDAAFLHAAGHGETTWPVTCPEDGRWRRARRPALRRPGRRNLREGHRAGDAGEGRVVEGIARHRRERPASDGADADARVAAGSPRSSTRAGGRRGGTWPRRSRRPASPKMPAVEPTSTRPAPCGRRRLRRKPRAVRNAWSDSPSGRPPAPERELPDRHVLDRP